MKKLAPQPLSPLDGRYASAVDDLAEHLSEAALNRARVHVEIEWIIFVCEHNLFGQTTLDDRTTKTLRDIVTNFDSGDVLALAETEKITRHDVKAVEYFVREKLNTLGHAHLAELTHITCTSEDINNLSYAITIKSAVFEVWLPKLDALIALLGSKAKLFRDIPMLSRTHGQAATPTTVGKELAVFVSRLTRQQKRIRSSEFLGKFSGATGTFSAHCVADAEQNWPELSRLFVESFSLTWNPLTTQIESHDGQAELFSAISHTNRIIHNLATDLWAYISIGYFIQGLVPGATGSSTMPHKINPIRFENAEANTEISCSLFDTLSETLVTSRWQRDLSDSSSQRNIGIAFGHSCLALMNITTGFAELSLDTEKLAEDLENNWEVLGEAIQTVIRAEIVSGRSAITDPYALLKELTRGKRVTAGELREFVFGLDISADAKKRLNDLTPHAYIGFASQLVSFLD